MFDNERLRVASSGAAHVAGTVSAITPGRIATVVAADVGQHDPGGLARVWRARIVIDARGASRPVSVTSRTGFQRAFGVVVDDRPSTIGGDAAVLMDWRPPWRAGGDPTFLYVMPLPEGRWLVEETSLARRDPMTTRELRERLVARVGADLVASARRIEEVTIPMTPGVPGRGAPVPRFGAAAGYVHPATGYSVAASLRAADRVAAAVVEAMRVDDPSARAVHVWNAVWPAEQRRARALHDYGLAALLRLSADDIGVFFDAFFSLPVERWAPYLRVDTTTAELRRTMGAVFARVPWAVRRRLATGSPLPFARLVP